MAVEKGCWYFKRALNTSRTQMDGYPGLGFGEGAALARLGCSLVPNLALEPSRQGKQTLARSNQASTTSRPQPITAMEPHSLKTASAYINNLLLSRGLLRNGKPIEFAHPSRGEGGKEATMAQIINLIHDLILKRDVC